MDRQPVIKSVIVAVRLASVSWRDFLSGFFDYARTNVHWEIKLVQSPDELADAIRNPKVLSRTHGIVTCFRIDDEDLSILNAARIPVIVVGREDERLCKRLRACAVVRHDDEGIGAFAARHFLSLGNFSSFGVVSLPSEATWVSLRMRGYQQAVESLGRACHVFLLDSPTEGEDNRGRLARWLAELPKPAAVFVVYDRWAIDVLAVCKEARIPVPGQVAVIGVGNDRLLCDFADPPLTSIAPDHEDEGRSAARVLDAMTNRRHRLDRQKVIITGKRIAERESAVPTSPATALVRRAINFITASASKNIKAGDVASRLKVSRSLLDMRFMELKGMTVSAFITDTRLDEVKRRLRKTRQSIRGISRECGFTSPNHLKNLFKRHVGTSMREYRQGLSADEREHPLA